MAIWKDIVAKDSPQAEPLVSAPPPPVNRPRPEVVPSAPNRPALNPEQGRIKTRRSLDVRDLQGDAEYLWRLWHRRSRAT